MPTVKTRLISTLTALLMIFSMAQLAAPAAQAKTLAAQPAENIFFYVKNSAGKQVLLRIMPLDELHDRLSHSQGLAPGDKSGSDYYVSYTDNLPTYCYRQGVGFTLDELAKYVEDNMSAPNLAGVDLTYAGNDKMGFIPTDAPIYAGGLRSYNTVYGVERYYFEGLYDYWTAEGFETNEDSPGSADSNYRDDSAEAEPKYFTADKNAVFATGVPMKTILMTESYSDRIMYLQEWIDANGGVVADCLAGHLERAESMSIGFTQTEQGMRTGERTASTNTKWIYQVDLDMENDPAIAAEEIAAPTCSVSASGSTATITLDCAPGAAIYHNLVPDGQGGYTYQSSAGDGTTENYGVMYPYTGPIQIDMTNLPSMNIRFRAVKEGCSDAGLQTVAYPKNAPTFPSGIQAPLGSDLLLSPSGTPSSEVWTAWTGAITGIGLKAPGAGAYTPLQAADYTIDNTNRTITLNKSLFTTTGSYSIQISADSYQDRVISRTLAGVAPAINPAAFYILGQAITLTFEDPYGSYGPSATVRVTPPGASTSSLISTTYLERLPGSITIKDSYMTYASGKIKQPGEYILTIANSNYIPSSQDVPITVVDPSSVYPVAVDETITGGTIAASPTAAAAGDTVTLTVTPDSGKQLVAGSLRYTTDGATYTAITGNSFTMPAAAVTVTAQFSATPDKTPPALTPDTTGNTVGQAVYLTFTDDATWRDAITGVTVNGTPVQGYALASGALTIPAHAFTASGDYTIVVTATGYSDAAVTQRMAETDDFTYTFSGGLATITGYTGDGGDIVIPGAITVSGTVYAVTAIGNNAFDAKTTITSVTIPASLTSIGEGAFTGCTALSAAYFLGGLPTFGTNVFQATPSSFVLYYHVANAASWSGYTTYPAQAFCTLTLDLQDGSTPTSSYAALDGNGHLSAPADPAREDHTFGGWYKEPVCTNAFDFGSETVTGDLTLYAKWTENSTGLPAPTLTADTTGNTVGQAIEITFTDDEAWRGAIRAITVNTTALTGEQYTVSPGQISLAAGLFTAPGDYAVTVTANGYGDATVTQRMNQATTAYTVTFISDGATYTTVTAASGATIEAPADPAKDGYAFGGWYADQAWTTAVSFPYTVTGDVAFYAKWTPATAEHPRYTITPVEEAAVYETGTTPGGISAMTVKTGVSGLKYFSVQVTPVKAHEGKESVVFVHLRNEAQQRLNVTRADFDTVQTAQAGFNVQPGDIVEVYIVDDLTNAVDHNPTILQ